MLVPRVPLVVVVLMALMNQLSGFIFLLILLTPLISTYVQTKIGFEQYKIRMERMVIQRKASYINYLLTNDIACKEIKVYESGAFFRNRLSKIKLKIQDQDFRMYSKKTLWDVGLSLVEEILSGLVLVYLMVLSLIGQLAIGSAVACVDSLSSIQSNVSSFLRTLANLYNDALSIEQFFLLMDLRANFEVGPVAAVDAIENMPVETITSEIKSIEFRHVFYRYPGSDHYVIKDLNLALVCGEKVAIVGENGAGKTTFIKLLCGLYDDYEGEILVNGVDMRRLDTQGLRRRMGIVFQDFNRYEMSIRDNLSLGDELLMHEDKALLEALEKVNLSDKVMAMGQGLDTQMGHWFGGEELSKGQWQRVAIARALLRDSDVYILDEPTASLDPVAERQIFQLMAKQSRDKLCVFVTHRIENLKLVNPRVIVLGEGENAGVIGDAAREMLA